MLILLKLFYRFKIASNKIPGGSNVGTETNEQILKYIRELKKVKKNKDNFKEQSHKIEYQHIRKSQ